jgi:RNA polymerase sigma-70 factor (ECF subfamily)
MSQEQNKIALFEKTILPHLDAAYNLARWIMNNDQDAEDMVQESYLRAYKYFTSFHGTNSRAWLLTIVRNTCYTWIRENRSEEITTDLEEDVYDSESYIYNPELLLQHYLDTKLVRRALQELTLKFREIIILRDLEGLSYKEIAGIASIPIGTVMSRLARAHQQLKQGLLKITEKEGLNEP